MKVLMIYNLYYENDKNSISHQDKIRSSFETAFGDDENYTYETVHFGDGPGFVKNAKEMNEVLLTKDFDVALVSEELDFIVYLETAKKLGKKLFLFHWDTFLALSSDLYVNFRITMKKPRIWGEFKQPVSIQEFSQYCNILVADYGYGEVFPNMYCVPTPIDTRYYNTDGVTERDIDVGHNGMFYIQERSRYAEIFQKANLPVVYTGSSNKRIFPAQVLPLGDFAEIYKRSKISLCFTESIFGPLNRQRKGRIFEVAACGSFLLLTHPEVLKSNKGSWFTLGEHFDYIDESNCVDKIRYYLNNPEKRIAMANAMHEHFMKTCAPRIWWENIFTWSKDK